MAIFVFKKPKLNTYISQNNPLTHCGCFQAELPVVAHFEILVAPSYISSCHELLKCKCKIHFKANNFLWLTRYIEYVLTMAVDIYSYTFDFDTFKNNTFKSVIFTYFRKWIFGIILHFWRKFLSLHFQKWQFWKYRNNFNGCFLIYFGDGAKFWRIWL